jgi:hypothetical protein
MKDLISKGWALGLDLIGRIGLGGKKIFEKKKEK